MVPPSACTMRFRAHDRPTIAGEEDRDAEIAHL
jgi:hypothetical protein